MSWWRRSQTSPPAEPLRPWKRPQRGVSSSVRIRIGFFGSCFTPQPKQFSAVALPPKCRSVPGRNLGRVSACLVFGDVSVLPFTVSASSKRASELPGTRHQRTFRAGVGSRISTGARRSLKPPRIRLRRAPRPGPALGSPPRLRRPRTLLSPRVLCRLLWGHQSSAPA